jgi:hypothetical protein
MARTRATTRPVVPPSLQWSILPLHLLPETEGKATFPVWSPGQVLNVEHRQQQRVVRLRRCFLPPSPRRSTRAVGKILDRALRPVCDPVLVFCLVVSNVALRRPRCTSSFSSARSSPSLPVLSTDHSWHGGVSSPRCTTSCCRSSCHSP